MNISGLEILENISKHIDEKMHKLKAESVLNFCKHHGIPKKDDRGDDAAISCSRAKNNGYLVCG